MKFLQVVVLDAVVVVVVEDSGRKKIWIRKIVCEHCRLQPEKNAAEAPVKEKHLPVGLWNNESANQGARTVAARSLHFV